MDAGNCSERELEAPR